MGGGIFKSITLSRYLFYIPLLYNVYLKIFQGVSEQEFERFKDKVITLNTLFAIFYILDSSGIYTIYTGEKYFSEVTQFGLITRNYDTFPPLTIFVIVFLLIKVFMEKTTILNILLLIINTLAVFFTYTRSIIISLGIIVVIFISLILRFKMIKSKFVMVTIFTLAIFAGAYSLFANYFSGSLLFLMDRFQPQNSILINDNNFISRFSLLNYSYSVSKQFNSVWFGAGFLQAGRDTMDKYLASWSGDIMWTNFILQVGIIGSILFLLFVLGIIFKLLKRIRARNIIGMGLLLITIYYLITSFTSEGFLGYFYLPVMYLSIAEVEIHNLWNIKLI
jgi:hypothetical protein